jgi:hypothetical protein
MKKLVEINQEIGKYSSQRNSAGKLMDLKNDYRAELVNECVTNLIKIQSETSILSERDLKIFINNMALDIRDIYLN